MHASSSRDGLLPPLVVQLSSWEDDTIHDVRLLLEGTSFSYPLPLNDTDGRAKTPNYNDLVMDFFEYDNTTRVIYHDYSLDIDHDILKQEAEKSPTKKMDEYYAFDDDFKRNTYYQSYDDDKLYQQKRCHRVSWHRHMPIECNKFHEFDFGGQTTKGLTHLLSSGAFKNVFLVMSGQDTMVYKMFVMKRRYDYKDYESNRVDSMVNERLDSSPYIVDLYGYCGLAQFGEAMPDGDMEEFAAPENGRHRISVKVYDEKELDPKNYLLPSEKISFCLQMAEALQLLHGYPGGYVRSLDSFVRNDCSSIETPSHSDTHSIVFLLLLLFLIYDRVIVHDDIQLGQYLLTPDLKHIKLNDFNR